MLVGDWVGSFFNYVIINGKVFLFVVSGMFSFSGGSIVFFFYILFDFFKYFMLDNSLEIWVKVKFVQDIFKYWYKFEIFREQVIVFFKDQELGVFIICDSYFF